MPVPSGLAGDHHRSIRDVALMAMGPQDWARTERQGIRGGALKIMARPAKMASGGLWLGKKIVLMPPNGQWAHCARAVLSMIGDHALMGTRLAIKAVKARCAVLTRRVPPGSRTISRECVDHPVRRHCPARRVCNIAPRLSAGRNRSLPGPKQQRFRCAPWVPEPLCSLISLLLAKVASVIGPPLSTLQVGIDYATAMDGGQGEHCHRNGWVCGSWWSRFVRDRKNIRSIPPPISTSARPKNGYEFTTCCGYGRARPRLRSPCSGCGDS